MGADVAPDALLAGQGLDSLAALELRQKLQVRVQSLAVILIAYDPFHARGVSEKNLPLIDRPDQVSAICSKAPARNYTRVDQNERSCFMIITCYWTQS